MARLTDDMKTARVMKRAHGLGIPDRVMHHGGGPCPFCDGERQVSEYIQITVHRRNLTKGVKVKSVVFPGFWQGVCHECALGIALDLGRRAKRDDYVRKVSEAEGRRDGDGSA